MVATTLFVVTKGFDFVKIIFRSSYQRIIRRRMDQSDYGNPGIVIETPKY
jgi:hypothetical protein